MKKHLHPLGFDTDGSDISPVLKKRMLEDESTFFQAKKIKQEDHNSNEEMIMELQEKVARQETSLHELRQEIRHLQQYVNTGWSSNELVLSLIE